MNNAFKGALLSGLIFPGSGQIFLGKKGQGIALIIATNIGLAGLLFNILKRIPLILAQIETELATGHPSLDRIMELIIPYSSVDNDFLLGKLSLAIIITCWLLSIIHAWFLGTQQDKAKPPKKTNSAENNKCR